MACLIWNILYNLPQFPHPLCYPCSYKWWICKPPCLFRELDPRLLFLYVGNLFTLLPTRWTSHSTLWCYCLGAWLIDIYNTVSSLKEESSVFSFVNTLCLRVLFWACRIYCINTYRVKVIIRKKLLREGLHKGCLETKGDSSLDRWVGYCWEE